jgi:hypothetical protein
VKSKAHKSYWSPRAFALSIAFCALSLPALGHGQVPAAPAKPDFSGRWRMVKDKSGFGGFTAPDIVVRVVEHRDPTLNVHTVQTSSKKTSTVDVSYFTDGSQTTNTMSGRDAVSKAFWDGPALVIRTMTKDSKGEDQVVEDRWEVSEDRQTLTISSHITTPKGQVDMKLVCEREKVGG